MNFQMPGMKFQEHLKITRTIGISPEDLVATAKMLLQPTPYPLPQILEAGSDDNLKDLLS